MGELAISMSSGEEDSEPSQDSGVLGRFAVASVLLFVYTLVAGDMRMSIMFFTLATFLYVLDIKRRPSKLSLI